MKLYHHTNSKIWSFALLVVCLNNFFKIQLSKRERERESFYFSTVHYTIHYTLNIFHQEKI